MSCIEFQIFDDFEEINNGSVRSLAMSDEEPVDDGGLDIECDFVDTDQHDVAVGNAPDDSAKPDEATTTELKKKRVVRKPQPKLDGVRLMGPKGIIALKNSFADFDFESGDKGREAESLDLILKRYEHWAHRMFPRSTFHDVLAQVRKLGRNMAIKNYMYRLRTDQLRPNELDDQGEEEITDPPAADAGNISDASVTVDPFDELMADADTMLLSDMEMLQESLPIFETESVTQPVTNITVLPSTNALTSEQLERMENNRLLALEKRNARLRALQLQEEQQVGGANA